MELVNEMLDKLPEEVWTDKNLKWFDPASGMGNFPIAVYLRLMRTLKEEIPNKKNRKKHILENMLYMSELNKKNVFVCKRIFDINDEYKLNIYNGDTLGADFKKIFGIKKFDIIIGNPPYNKDISKNNAGGQVIWISFVKKVYSLLKKNSYLLFIHPPNYRKPEHELHDIFFNNQLYFIKIMGEKESKKYFNCNIRVDYYLLQKCLIYKKTLINDEYNINYKIKINDNIKYIPNYGISIHLKLQNIDVNNLICINPRSHDTTRKYVSKNKSNEYNIKLFNTSSSKGLTYYYTSKKHPFQDIKKVMFSNGRYIYPFYDNGILGGTQSCLFIEVNNKNKGEEIINYINSNLFKFLIKSSKFNNFSISHTFISNIPNLTLLLNKINNKKIHKLLELTDEEINTIKI